MARNYVMNCALATAKRRTIMNKDQIETQADPDKKTDKIDYNKEKQNDLGNNTPRK